MRWSSPRKGDLRKVRKFAWLPTECDEGVTVWLELYTAVEEFQMGFEDCGWRTVRREAD